MITTPETKAKFHRTTSESFQAGVKLENTGLENQNGSELNVNDSNIVLMSVPTIDQAFSRRRIGTCSPASKYWPTNLTLLFGN